MPGRIFRWCFIGAGSLANQVAGQITADGLHRIASVYTRRLEQGQNFAIRYGGLAYRTPEEAILAPGVDAVYVCTPHNSHYRYAKLALELGKPVLCEKPITVAAKEAEELAALAREKHLYLAEAMWTWFSPVAQQVKEWLHRGAFGEIQNVDAHYHLNVVKGYPRLTDPTLAGGALLDSGIYPVTYLYRLFGMPVKIQCQGTVENGVDYGEEIQLTFADGKTWPISISIRDFDGLEKLILEGSEAKIKLMFFHGANQVTLVRADGEKETFRGDGSLHNEFNRVAEEIAAGRTESQYVPLDDTLAVMHILDECRRQMNLVYPFEAGLPEPYFT